MLIILISRKIVISKREKGKVKYYKALKEGFKTSWISLEKEVVRFLLLPSRFKDFFCIYDL